MNRSRIGIKPDLMVTEVEERMRLYPYTYIAGPMTGYKEFNHPEFNRVAKLLRDKGLKVINPAEIEGRDPNNPDRSLSPMPWDFYLRRDLALITKKVGRIVLLSGWRNSHGATLEKYVCEALRCEIIHCSEFEDWYATLTYPGGKIHDLL